MSTLTAVVTVGSRPPLGGGIDPDFVAHLYGSAWPWFVLYEVRPVDGASDAGPELCRLGAFAPVFDSDPPSPLTDLLLAVAPGKSAVSDLLATLDTKATANYDTSFREKIFEGDVSRGSLGYGRLFEARSQLEAHPYEGAIAVSVLAGVTATIENGLRDNITRLDADVEVLASGPFRRHER